MPCDLKFQVRSFKEGKDIIGAMTLGSDISEELKLTLDDVVNYFVQLPKAKRLNLADRLRSAKAQTLTTSDLKKYNFISNTSLDDLLTKYPEFKELYKDILVNPEDNYTLIYAHNVTLGGKKYSGRIINSEGNEIFIIGGKYGTQQFLDYLDIKSKIGQAFDENGKLKEDFKAYLETLDAAAARHKKNGISLLHDFQNNRSKYNPTEVRQLNKLLANISGNIDDDPTKSELYTTLENYVSKEKSGNRWDWKIASGDLVKVILEFFPDNEVTKESILDMSDEELSELVLNVFANDPKLMKLRVKEVKSGKTKEVTKAGKQKSANQDAVKKLWSAIKSTNPDIKGSLDKNLEADAKATLAIFEEFFKNNEFTDDGENYPATVRLGDSKNGKKRIEISYTTKDTTVSQSSDKIITLTRPWSSLGETYGFSYDTEYMWSPVLKYDEKTNPNGIKELDKDGMYHGMYIYEYFNPRTNSTNYAISRHILSPGMSDDVFLSLLDAEAKIDWLNSSLTIKDNSLYSLKQEAGIPRTSIIQSKNVREGQVITTLDVKLPSSNLPSFLWKVFCGTVPEFYETFKTIPNIQALRTPELAAIFIMLFNLKLKTAEAENLKNKEYTDFATLLLEHVEDGKSIVENILKLGTKSFRLERLAPSNNNQFGTLSLLLNDGNQLDITGKFGDESAMKPTIATIQLAADYFNKYYGLNIQVQSKQEFDAFNEQEGLLLTNDTRAFVYNGNIYLNGSKADVSDMFHEMSHIFLGLVKAKSREAYLDVVQQFISKKPTEFSKKLNYISRKYSKFSYEDRVEETIVNMIADEMFKKKSLASTFNGSDFANDFNFILETVQQKYPALIEGSDLGSLGFLGLVQSLRTESNIEGMNKNMKVSLLIRSYIDLKLIKEWGC